MTARRGGGAALLNGFRRRATLLAEAAAPIDMTAARPAAAVARGAAAPGKTARGRRRARWPPRGRRRAGGRRGGGGRAPPVLRLLPAVEQKEERASKLLHDRRARARALGQEGRLPKKATHPSRSRRRRCRLSPLIELLRAGQSGTPSRPSCQKIVSRYPLTLSLPARRRVELPLRLDVARPHPPLQLPLTLARLRLGRVPQQVVEVLEVLVVDAAAVVVDLVARRAAEDGGPSGGT